MSGRRCLLPMAVPSSVVLKLPDAAFLGEWSHDRCQKMGAFESKVHSIDEIVLLTDDAPFLRPT